MYGVQFISKIYFNDIEEAFKNDEPHYFIGTTLSSKKDLSTYELIDGQQRNNNIDVICLGLP